MMGKKHTQDLHVDATCCTCKFLAILVIKGKENMRYVLPISSVQ